MTNAPPPGARFIMDAAEIARAVRRMAHELLETNRGAADLVVLGIPTRGVPLAQMLADELNQIEGTEIGVGTLDITMYRDDLRRQPTRAVQRTWIPEDIEDKVVVLVDDVLFSGRTIAAAIDALKDLGRPRAVRLAVLVDRGHRELPIAADVVGKHLPTTQTERVQVQLRDTDGIDQVAISDPSFGDHG